MKDAEGDPPASDAEFIDDAFLRIWPLSREEVEMNTAFLVSDDPIDIALRESMMRTGGLRPLRAGMQYILDEQGEPVDCPNVLKWGRWMEDGHRIVKRTVIANGAERRIDEDGEDENAIVVSTVFLGINHNHGRLFRASGVRPELPEDVELYRPILWETMIFGPMGDHHERRMRTDHDGLPEELHHFQERYSSAAEAIAGHIRAVDAVLAQLGKQPTEH